MASDTKRLGAVPEELIKDQPSLLLTGFCSTGMILCPCKWCYVAQGVVLIFQSIFPNLERQLLIIQKTNWIMY